MHVQILLGVSESQIQDCMLLRQLYHTKRALLSMERRELLNQMTHVEHQLPHPCEHVVVLTDLSTCLKDNSAESHLVHYRVARAFYRGVSYLALNVDTAMVHAALVSAPCAVWRPCMARQHLPHAHLAFTVGCVLAVSMIVSVCLSHMSAGDPH